MKRRAILAAAAALAFAAAANSAPSKPDIVFVLVDSVRPSHMGCYGYPRGTTPFLDRFAREEAVRFETVADGRRGELPDFERMELLYLEAWMDLQDGRADRAGAALGRIVTESPDGPTAEKARKVLESLGETKEVKR